jgi:hypothetical protein
MVTRPARRPGSGNPGQSVALGRRPGPGPGPRPTGISGQSQSRSQSESAARTPDHWHFVAGGPGSDSRAAVTVPAAATGARARRRPHWHLRRRTRQDVGLPGRPCHAGGDSGSEPSSTTSPSDYYGHVTVAVTVTVSHSPADRGIRGSDEPEAQLFKSRPGPALADSGGPGE